MSVAVRKNYYPYVDICKIVLIMVVVFIHSVHYVNVPTWSFFAVSSGFFLWGRIDESEDRLAKLKIIRSYVRHILLLYLVWTVIYIPFSIYGFKMDPTISMCKGFLIWIRNVLFVGENYLSWPLWYLLAIIYCGVGLYFIKKINCPIFVPFCVSAIIYVSARMFHFDDIEFYTRIFKSTRNFIAVAPLFFGGCCMWYIKELVKTPIIPCAVLLVAIIVAYVYPACLDYLVSPALFWVCLQIPGGDAMMEIAKKLRMMSSIIYVSHMLFVGVFLILFPTIGKGLLLFALSSFCTIIFAGIFISTAESTKLYKIFFHP